MLIKRLTYSLLFLCVVPSAHAQDSLSYSQDRALHDILLRDYQFVKQHNPWLTSKNAAGLTSFYANSIAETEAGMSYSKGDLIDYWQSPTVLQGDVRAEAFQRLSSKTVVYGSISYNNFSGSDMTGSAFIDPTHKPFDIVEASQDNKGRKHRDTYQLAGAIGIELWKGFSVGCRTDYTSANYAKYKDLRHSNKLMDLNMSVGVMGHVLSHLSVGANYIYHRNTESMTFNTYGKIDKVYKSLISYGGFMGRLEQFGTTGYTEKGREMPLVEDQHGGSLQIEWHPTAKWSLYNEASIAHGTGYYGRKSPYTITFTNHDRDLLSYHGSLRYHTVSSLHRLDVNISSEKLTNNAETYQELTNEYGAHYYEYYDAVKTADKEWTNLGVSYTADLKVKAELPTWTLNIGMDWQQRKQTGILYPYYRKQKLTTTRGYATATRNIVMSKGVLAATVRLSYQKGSGKPFTDGVYQTPSADAQTPPTMADWLYQEYRYLTAAQYAVGADVKYTFLIPRIKISAFVKGGFDYATSQANEYTKSDNRIRLSLSVGHVF